jgi:hypothetical protein
MGRRKSWRGTGRTGAKSWGDRAIGVLIITTSLGEYAYILVNYKATGENTPEMFGQRRFARA